MLRVLFVLVLLVCSYSVMDVVTKELLRDLRTGTDPEILHGRWLMGWLPIAIYTGQGGWLVNNGGHLLYYVARKN